VLCVGAYLDVTDQKEAEASLRDADRKKDDFIALLAHELRNPLAPIRNGLNVLRLAGADGEAVRETREIMERQIAHMVRLIEDLLDVARIARGAIELRLDRIDLTPVVEQAIESVRPSIEQRHHAIAVTLPPDPVYLLGDAARLHQALVNLLNNAARYTPPGGRIAVELRREAECAVLRVNDTGEGIASEMLPHIFGLFFQGDRTLARTGGGLGIGLAVVKSLAELHGGSVLARSPGRGLGSEFILRLPLLKRDPAEPGAPAHSSPRETDLSQAPAPNARR
jgi:signal transduction histidine kinase